MFLFQNFVEEKRSNSVVGIIPKVFIEIIILMRKRREERKKILAVRANRHFDAKIISFRALLRRDQLREILLSSNSFPTGSRLPTEKISNFPIGGNDLKVILLSFYYVYLVSFTMGKAWDCVKPKSIHSFGIVAYNSRMLAFSLKFGIFRPYTWYFSNY